MLWYRFPLGLVKILADVLGARVIGAVPFDSFRPMVGSPKNVNAGRSRTGTPSAKPGEQIDCCCHEYSSRDVPDERFRGRGSYRESSLARFFDQASTSSTTLLLNMLRWR